jgi:hypothetical protein
MKLADSLLASTAFATPGAGSGYFATEEHYRHLAKGVVAALRQGGLVLVTGDPPACLPMLIEALKKAAMPRSVIAISCEPALDCNEPLGSGGQAAPGPPVPGRDEGEEAESAALPCPILVFDNADRLSDAQIKVLLEAAQAAPVGEARVLAAHSSFPTRLEWSGSELLKGKLAAHLRLQQLGRDEVEAFIRYQLPPDSASNFFTAQRVALIAITSGGDPTVVNRLARRMLEQEPRAPAGSLLSKLSRSGARKTVSKELTVEPGPSIAGSEIAPLRTIRRRSASREEEPGAPAGSLLTKLRRVWRSGARKPVGEGSTTTGLGANIADDKIAPPGVRRRRLAASLKFALGAIVCLGIFGLMVGVFGSKNFDNLLHSHVLPQKDSGVPSEEVQARVALPLAPPVATGSPSAGVAVDPPRAAPEPAAQPAEAGPARPRAAPSSPVAPEPTGKPVPAGSRLSADEITALLARGDAFLSAGDIASARLFFQRAADAGDSRAAMRMAVTFDGAFLDRAGLRGLRGDPQQAAFWYRRARDLGAVKTEHGTAPATEPPSQLR